MGGGRQRPGSTRRTAPQSPRHPSRHHHPRTPKQSTPPSRSRRQRTSPTAPRPRPSSLHSRSPSFLRRQKLATSSVGTRSPTPTAHPNAVRRRVARWSTTLRRSCLRRNDGERECDGHAAWVIEAGAIWCAGSLPSTPHLTSPLEETFEKVGWRGCRGRLGARGGAVGALRGGFGRVFLGLRGRLGRTAPGGGGLRPRPAAARVCAG